MATDGHAVDRLSDGIAGTDALHRLEEVNDSAIIEVTDRDRQFLDHLERQNQLKFESVAANQVLITTTGYAGVIALPDGNPIHIVPKVTGTPLLRLLQYSGTTDVKTIEQEAGIEAGLEYVDLLGTLFADELERVRRRGISQSYRAKEATEDYIRGRLNLQQQLQRKGPAAPTFECSYDELTRDTKLNRTILFATQILVGAVTEPTLQRRLRRHVHEFRRLVTLHPITFEEADQIQLTRLDNYYADLLRLSKLVLQNIYIRDVAPGQAAGYTILLRMYDQFEKAVENAVSAAASEYTVRTGHDASLRSFLDGEFGIRPEPDIVIEDSAGKPILVLDAKWKTLEGAVGRWSPSREDIYQMLSYQQHVETPGVLVYPGRRGGLLGSADSKNADRLWLASLPVEGDDDSSETYGQYRERLDTALTGVLDHTIADS